MYIIVRHSDNVIIGSATRPVDELLASRNNYRVYEIDDTEFSIDMLGSKLAGFDEVVDDNL
jgi:hypothetical protein